MRHGAHAATHTDVEELARLVVRPAVSLLVPANGAGPPTREEPIRLKNLLRRAAERLGEEGFSEPDADAVLGPARELLDDAAFWRGQSAALAIYLAPGFARIYTLARRVRERAVVGSRFHVTPLIAALAESEHFYVLALSQNDVRLVHATRDTALAVDLGDLPRTLADALATEPPGLRLQQHVATTAGGGERAVMFHGHGGGGDVRKEEVRQFLHRVDRGVQPLISPRDAPVVLAAVDYLQSIYREVSRLPRLLEEGIAGNPEGLAPEALGARAWEIVAKGHAARRAHVVERYRQLAGTGLASADLGDILRAAREGRVADLLVIEDAERRGALDPDSGVLAVREAPGPGAEDLVDVAVSEAFNRRCTVWVIPPDAAPDGAPVFAIYRY